MATSILKIQGVSMSTEPVRGRVYKCDPSTETIVFNGRKYHRNPNSKQKHRQRYFWGRREYGNGQKITLHVAIWEYHNGPVPEGWCLHHKDKNPLNNDISNLECVSLSEHGKIHKTGKNLSGHRHKMLYRHKCDQCGCEYQSFRKTRTRTRFCSPECGQKHLCERRKVRRREARRLQSERS